MGGRIAITDLEGRVGQLLGVSDWIPIDQARINAFADATLDHNFLHVDPELARRTPFGTTIAHGFLTLSLLAPMAYSALPQIDGAVMGLNYGLNRVRFLSPVRAGRRVRGHFRLLGLERRPEPAVRATYDVTVEIEGEERPALAAEWISLVYLAPSA
ncbi:MAG: MaoC family dehydratase [Sphingomonadaceae bacterium]|uniref:MaoC family dehydratase n=1 Tax=Thermaurantiacus sp. TaxID=2820283 RepID=UPI00298EFC7F|nr:MaoC family dehydratase [Thermaurantiacus sp.]MCS6986786.1 MaoC family dehydratase [Sphingomonadaceae bacterium]